MENEQRIKTNILSNKNETVSIFTVIVERGLQFHSYIKREHYPFFEASIKPYLGESKAGKRRAIYIALIIARPPKQDLTTVLVNKHKLGTVMKTEDLIFLVVI
ncbi:unnamed protein product [Arctia plantaginis]|uniref:Uncharacterized protein n=1 Tax=Arctia plantaginis TaxID=874455 RepID=A0A8S0ZT87_ARCPL|nr:unnamed protein product [Arctia plantaginis]CAB3250660.1 unnamed protein product [Arctia plantaginis]